MLRRVADGRQHGFFTHIFFDLPRQDAFAFGGGKLIEINFAGAGDFTEGNRHVVLGKFLHVFDRNQLAARLHFKHCFVGVQR